MKRKPFMPIDPVTAREIALHTADALRCIRACTTVGEVDGLLASYARYAEAKEVAPAIREHVEIAGRETITTLKALARQGRSSAEGEQQSITARMIGDRDDETASPD